MYLHINSEYLQLAEPLMAKYYDFHSTMLIDEIKHCVESSGVDYKKLIDGVLTVDYDLTFRQYKELTFIRETSYTQSIEETFSQYFDFLEVDSTEEETITDDDIVYMCLTIMSYVYHKETKDLFNQSVIVDTLDLEYQSVLRKRIYPEMLSLYKIILESKTKKHRGSKITLTYKQDKIDINSCAWFLDDMERMFKEGFPDLTLEQINQLLPDNKNKAGRKFNNRITNNLIWGTYQLLYNHYSRFKNSKTRISEEICQFILDYLDCLGIENEFILPNVREIG